MLEKNLPRCPVQQELGRSCLAKPAGADIHWRLQSDLVVASKLLEVCPFEGERSKWSWGLQTLSLKSCFNQSILEVKWPRLQSLTFGSCFNQPLQLPDSGLDHSCLQKNEVWDILCLEGPSKNSSCCLIRSRRPKIGSLGLLSPGLGPKGEQFHWELGQFTSPPQHLGGGFGLAVEWKHQVCCWGLASMRACRRHPGPTYGASHWASTSIIPCLAPAFPRATRWKLLVLSELLKVCRSSHLAMTSISLWSRRRRSFYRWF